MANIITSPNMSLPIPVPGVDSGPDYALNLNAALAAIDSHNHAPGSGVQINPTGLNINSDLTFNNNNAFGLRSTRFTVQTSPLSNATDLGCLYVSGVDLYFNDVNSNQIKITSGGSVFASSSGISSGSASASFSSGVLVVNAASNTPANIQAGSILLGNNISGSKFLTLSPPSSMPSNYSLTLPSIPASQSFMSIDTSGNISGYAPVANGITRPNLAAVGQQISGSCGSQLISTSSYTAVTNFSVTLTTTGRPVMIFAQSDGTTGNVGTWFMQLTSGSGPCFAQLGISRNGGSTFIANIGVGNAAVGTLSAQSHEAPPSSLQFLDTPSAGTYTYTVYAKTAGATNIAPSFMTLVAYEL